MPLDLTRLIGIQGRSRYFAPLVSPWSRGGHPPGCPPGRCWRSGRESRPDRQQQRRSCRPGAATGAHRAAGEDGTPEV